MSHPFKPLLHQLFSKNNKNSEKRNVNCQNIIILGQALVKKSKTFFCSPWVVFLVVKQRKLSTKASNIPFNYFNRNKLATPWLKKSGPLPVIGYFLSFFNHLTWNYFLTDPKNRNPNNPNVPRKFGNYWSLEALLLFLMESQSFSFYINFSSFKIPRKLGVITKSIKIIVCVWFQQLFLLLDFWEKNTCTMNNVQLWAPLNGITDDG